jgi:hypothetical protein
MIMPGEHLSSLLWGYFLGTLRRNFYFGTSKNQFKKILIGTRILHVDMTFSKKLLRVSDGFGILIWRVISSAHNLITVVHTSRINLHTTLNNICTVLTLTGIELGTPKSLYIQSVMSTFPLY